MFYGVFELENFLAGKDHLYKVHLPRIFCVMRQYLAHTETSLLKGEFKYKYNKSKLKLTL